jgi:hypothetical protein
MLRLYLLCSFCARKLGNIMFRKLDIFPSSGEERETTTLLVPLESSASYFLLSR